MLYYRTALLLLLLLLLLSYVQYLLKVSRPLFLHCPLHKPPSSTRAAMSFITCQNVDITRAHHAVTWDSTLAGSRPCRLCSEQMGSMCCSTLDDASRLGFPSETTYQHAPHDCHKHWCSSSLPRCSFDYQKLEPQKVDVMPRIESHIRTTCALSTRNSCRRYL